ncbi:hypothetical protein HYU10_05440 [Candidatus Woesearchaeota archaeon]|nr:hypothetical protein [Candidatus Woesearchaeota archaeon]
MSEIGDRVNECEELFGAAKATLRKGSLCDGVNQYFDAVAASREPVYSATNPELIIFTYRNTIGYDALRLDSLNMMLSSSVVNGRVRYDAVDEIIGAFEENFDPGKIGADRIELKAYLGLLINRLSMAAKNRLIGRYGERIRISLGMEGADADDLITQLIRCIPTAGKTYV